jgi:hypothetical protein
MKTYGESKIADLWTTNEKERRFGPDGLRALSVHFYVPLE